MYIVHTVLYTLPMALTRDSLLKIMSCSSLCFLIQQWYHSEKLDASQPEGLKGEEVENKLIKYCDIIEKTSGYLFSTLNMFVQRRIWSHSLTIQVKKVMKRNTVVRGVWFFGNQRKHQVFKAFHLTSNLRFLKSSKWMCQRQILIT